MATFKPIPKPAAPLAVTSPAVPAPITTKSYRQQGWGLPSQGDEHLPAIPGCIDPGV